MTHTNIIQEKSFNFSVKVVNAVRVFRKREKEFDITGQLLRSATSIGANVEEALGGYSKNDFRYKLSLSSKEARETKYWLRLMKATEMLDSNTLNELLNDCEEVLKILGAITRTLKIRNS